MKQIQEVIAHLSVVSFCLLLLLSLIELAWVRMCLDRAPFELEVIVVVGLS
jgi:hypothetical protein